MDIHLIQLQRISEHQDKEILEDQADLENHLEEEVEQEQLEELHLDLDLGEHTLEMEQHLQ
jgi:hypothetical protein